MPMLTDIELQVRRTLDDLGVEYEVWPCEEEFADTAAFCSRYGCDIGDAANTIVVQSRDKPPRFAACVLLGDTRLDVNGTVRRRMGRKSSFADADQVAALTGMTVGGVTAVGLPPGLPVWIDSMVFERDRVILGGGSRHSKLVVAPAALTRLPNAEVIDGLARREG